MPHAFDLQILHPKSPLVNRHKAGDACYGYSGGRGATNSDEAMGAGYLGQKDGGVSKRFLTYRDDALNIAIYNVRGKGGKGRSPR